MRKLVAFVSVIALSGVASADKGKDPQKADKLFRQAKKLMGEQRYADACKLFEESFELDPGIGGQANIARCYEEWGKLAVAHKAYEKAEAMAKAAHDSRAGEIHEHIETLEKEMPKLTLHVPKDAETEGLKVSLDGADIPLDSLTDPQAVDPGSHLLEYSLPGVKKKTKVVPVERGGDSDVTLDLPPKKKAVVVTTEPEKSKPVVGKPAGDPGKSRKLLAYGVGGGGVALVGVSAILTFTAKSKYDDALKNHCMGATDMCDMAGLDATHSARTRANIGTGFFIAGLAAVGAGAYLYFTAPKHHADTESAEPESAFYVAPTLSPDAGGLVVGGAF